MHEMTTAIFRSQLGPHGRDDTFLSAHPFQLSLRYRVKFKIR